MYGYQCDYCQGTVQPRTVKREGFKYRDGFVIVEDVTIGVGNNCGNRYYSANIRIEFIRLQLEQKWQNEWNGFWLFI